MKTKKHTVACENEQEYRREAKCFCKALSYYGTTEAVEPKPSHTPTPWKITYYEDGLLEGLNFIEGSDKTEVCSINDASTSGKANAAFIVRACNLHEDFMDLVRIVVGNDHMMNEVLPQSMAERLDAIAKAERGA